MKLSYERNKIIKYIMTHFRKFTTTLLLCFLTVVVFSQDNTVNIVSSGDGKTKDAATNAALRHCIEKTFGVFVTTNTTVVNDELVKDEITNIASGNIVSYEVLSEIKEADNYSITVSAVVSPDNIVKTFKSKGYSFEINGNVYAQNIQKEKYYKEQEPKILIEFLKKYIDYPIFDTFEIKVLEPFLNKDYLQIQRNLVINETQGFRNFGITYYKFGLKDKISSYLPGSMYNNASGGIQIFKNQMITYKSNGTNRDEFSNESESESEQTYAYPIIYTPHFNELNASDLSSVLKTFFTNISLKDPKYKDKYGDIYEANFLFQYSEINKRDKIIIRQETIKLGFRNPETVLIINEFASILEKRSNPNSLILNNANIFLNKKSYWAYQSSQNHTSLVNVRLNNDNKFEFDLNLADNFQPDNSSTSYSSYNNMPYKYHPVLIFFNVTEKELANLKKLDFNWKTNVKINDTEVDPNILSTKKNITINKNDTLKLFQYYSSSYASAVKNFKAKNWDTALIHFESAVLYIDYILSNKMARQDLKFDTASILFAGYAAQNANNITKTLKYYKRIADYGVSKFNKESISDIYKYILIKAAEAFNEAEHERYFAIAKKLFPNEGWDSYRWYYLSSLGENNRNSNRNAQKKKSYFD